MKRCFILSCALLFLLASALTFTVFAAPANTYYIPELDMNIQIPTDYYVITRDTDESAPIFSIFPVEHAEIMEYLESSNIYLDVMTSDLSGEFIVTMVSMSGTPLANFGVISDTLLISLMEGTKEQLRNSGMEVIDFEIYPHAQTKFVRINFKNTATSTYGLQYYTVYNEMAINFTTQHTTLANEIESIIDDLSFGSSSATADTPESEVILEVPTMPDLPEYTIPPYEPDVSDLLITTSPTVPDLVLSNTSYSGTSYYGTNNTYQSSTSTLLISLIITVLLALIPGFTAKGRGRSFWGYFLLSLVISPLIVTIIVLCLKKIEEFEPEESDWTCPVCGTDNDGIYTKCKNCGHQKKPAAPSQAEAESRRTPPTIPESGTWTCASCGTENKTDYSQCKKCGKFKGQS